MLIISAANIAYEKCILCIPHPLLLIRTGIPYNADITSATANITHALLTPVTDAITHISLISPAPTACTRYTGIRIISITIILAGISAIMPGLHVFIHTASVIIPPTIEKAAYSISLLGIL